MDLYNIFYILFLRTEFMSVQLRIILTILIIANIYKKNNIIEYLILVFYLPLILSIIHSVSAYLYYFLGYSNEYINSEVEFIKENFINLIYKIFLFIYILFYIQKPISKDIIAFSIIYIMFYYLRSDIKILYKSNYLEQVLALIFSIITLLIFEKVRLK